MRGLDALEGTHQTVVELLSNDAVTASSLHSNVHGSERVPPPEKMQSNGTGNPRGLVFPPRERLAVDSSTRRPQRAREVVFVVWVAPPLRLRLRCKQKIESVTVLQLEGVADGIHSSSNGLI